MSAAAPTARREALLWAAQRASAAVLAVCVAVHLATIVVAVQGGLSAAEILGRTRGSVGGLVFYLVFVFAAAVHVPIGLRSVLAEWLGWRGPARDALLLGLAMLLAWLGVTAALAVFL